MTYLYTLHKLLMPQIIMKRQGNSSIPMNADTKDVEVTVYPHTLGLPLKELVEKIRHEPPNTKLQEDISHLTKYATSIKTSFEQIETNLELSLVDCPAGSKLRADVSGQLQNWKNHHKVG